MFKIFVGNLSPRTTAEELHRLFIRHAVISDIAVPVDEATGKPRGFAIVMIKDEAQALAAIDALRGSRLDGRSLVINRARKKGEAPPPKPERRRGGGVNIRRGGGGGGGGGGGRPDRGPRQGSYGDRSGNPREGGGSGGGGGNRIRTFGSRPRSFGRPSRPDRGFRNDQPGGGGPGPGPGSGSDPDSSKS